MLFYETEKHSIIERVQENLIFFEYAMITTLISLSDDKILLDNKIQIIIDSIHKKDYTKMIDTIHEIIQNNNLYEYNSLFDVISSVNKEIKVKDKISLRDTCKIYWI
jgi:hypothetical protein